MTSTNKSDAGPINVIKIADFYEDEVDTAVANLMTLMEPVLILFLGTVVGGIVISMYLPIFDLINQMS